MRGYNRVGAQIIEHKIPEAVGDDDPVGTLFERRQCPEIGVVPGAQPFVEPFAEIARQVERAERIRKEKWDKLKAELQSRQEPEKSKNQQVEKTPDIEQPIPKKKQQEEDLELLKKPKRSRGFGMGM